MGEHVVASSEDLGPGDRLVTEVDGLDIGVFNLEGEYRAFLNFCAHQGGPLCEGNVVGTLDASFDREALEYEYEWIGEDEVIVCPWHNWEFDLRTGACLSRDDVAVPEFPVSVIDDEIVVHI